MVFVESGLGRANIMCKQETLVLDDSNRILWEEYAKTKSERIRGVLEAHYLHLVETLARQLARKLPECVDVGDHAE